MRTRSVLTFTDKFLKSWDLKKINTDIRTRKKGEFFRDKYFLGSQP